MNKKTLVITLSLITTTILGIIIYAVINYLFFSYGTLQIVSDYTDYKYTLDGNTSALVSGDQEIRTKTGRKKVTISKEGYSEQIETLNISRDKITQLITNLTLDYNDSDYPELRLPETSGI